MNKQKKSKILIFGITGLLGNMLYKYFREKNNFEIFGASRKNKQYSKNTQNIKIIKNLKNENELNKIVETIKPRYIINSIGLVKSSINENNILETFYINSYFPKIIEKIATINNCKLIHISTDCVFDGKKGNYVEEDATNANDLYGISKILGECESKHSLTIRTSIIGHSNRDKKGLLEWFLSRKKKIKGYSKAYFSGFTTLELAKILHDNIIKKNNFQSGIFHLSSKKLFHDVQYQKTFWELL